MNILDWIYYLMISLTVLAGLLRFRQQSTVFKLLILLLLYSLVSELSGKVVAEKRHNNMPFFHVYSLVEYLFLTSMYSKILQGVTRKIIITLIIPMCAFALFNSFYLQGINRFPSNFLLICELMYMCYAFLCFRQMLLNPIPIALQKQGFFWLNLAQIIYSTTLFINFGLINYLNSHHFNEDPLVIFVGVINLIYVALLATAIFKDANTTEYSKLNDKYKQ